MFRGLSVAVVVPAFNEERAIKRAIRSIPGLVDRIIVVDDASHDRTSSLATRSRRRSLEIVRHEANRGVGAAIITGYRRALALGSDVVVVMAGDGQMDPADLPALLEPIASGRADYVKGNRFLRREVFRVMPKARLVGNVLLSLATRLVSGYWHLFDSQCGYTAITRRTLEEIDLDRVFARYGYPNDLLARLHAIGARVEDVPVRPVYGPGWKSGIRLRTVFYPIAWVLLRALAWRLCAEWVLPRKRALGRSHLADDGLPGDSVPALNPGPIPRRHEA
ncbi:MAG: glycosyltransferase family 2 protein [Deltaproteobacteria bacterium]|nr:glycosyltransferase family 2 protein [Deltaproteobacteria bacterium]